eukprot:6146346-Amphidinium_carterae.2
MLNDHISCSKSSSQGSDVLNRGERICPSVYQILRIVARALGNWQRPLLDASSRQMSNLVAGTLVRMALQDTSAADINREWKPIQF